MTYFFFKKVFKIHSCSCYGIFHFPTLDLLENINSGTYLDLSLSLSLCVCVCVCVFMCVCVCVAGNGTQELMYARQALSY
jgi:hypothetical protein